MIKGAKRPLVIKRNKGALDLDRLFSQVNRRTANIQSEEDLIREEAPGGLLFYHNKLSYILDGREGVYRRNKVHLCLTTPELSLEKTPPPSAWNSQTAKEHWYWEADRVSERQQAEQFSSRRADKAIANQERTFLV